MSVAWRVTAVVVGALIVVLGLGGVSLVIGGEGVPAPQPSPTSTIPVEETLLLQVLDAEGYALGNFVIGIEQSPDSTTILAVPGSLLVSVGDDTMTLGMTPSSPDTLAAVKGVESTVGLRIDAGLTLDRLAFAGLVDAVDGVWVKMPTRVLLPAISIGGPLRVVGPGWIKLDGVTAADYATVALPGESEADRIQRMQGIVTLVLEGLPRTSERMRQLLTSLGSLAQSTVPTEQLVPFLLQVRWDVNFGQATYENYPVTIVRAGGRPASIPAPGAQELVDDLFPAATLPDGVTG